MITAVAVGRGDEEKGGTSQGRHLTIKKNI